MPPETGEEPYGACAKAGEMARARLDLSVSDHAGGVAAAREREASLRAWFREMREARGGDDTDGVRPLVAAMVDRHRALRAAAQAPGDAAPALRQRADQVGAWADRRSRQLSESGREGAVLAALAGFLYWSGCLRRAQVPDPARFPAVRACLRGGGCLDRWREEPAAALALLGAVHQLAGYRQGALLLEANAPGKLARRLVDARQPLVLAAAGLWDGAGDNAAAENEDNTDAAPPPPPPPAACKRPPDAATGQCPPATLPYAIPGGTSADAVPCCTRIKDTPLTQAGFEAMLTHGFAKMQKIQAKLERVEARLLARTRVGADGAVSTRPADPSDAALAARLAAKHDAVSAWLRAALERGLETHAEDARKCAGLHLERLRALAEKQVAEEKRNAIDEVVKNEKRGPTGGGVLALLGHLRDGGHRAAHDQVARACETTLGGGGDWMRVLQDNKDTVLKAAAAAGAVGTAYLFKDEISRAVQGVWTETVSLIKSLAAKLEELVRQIAGYELKFLGLRVPGLGVMAALVAAWHSGALQSMCRRETDHQFEKRAWSTATSWGVGAGVLGSAGTYAGAFLGAITAPAWAGPAMVTAGVGAAAAAAAGVLGYHKVKSAPLVGGRDYGWLCNVPVSWWNLSLGLGPAMLLLPAALIMGTTGAKTYVTTGNPAAAAVAATRAGVDAGVGTVKRVGRNWAGVARAARDHARCTGIQTERKCTNTDGCAWDGDACHGDGATMPGVGAATETVREMGRTAVQVVSDAAAAARAAGRPRDPGGDDAGAPRHSTSLSEDGMTDWMRNRGPSRLTRQERTRGG